MRRLISAALLGVAVLTTAVPAFAGSYDRRQQQLAQQKYEQARREREREALVRYHERWARQDASGRNGTHRNAANWHRTR